MVNPSARLCFAAVMLAAVVTTPRAAGPVFWTMATAADFIQGRSEGAVVSLDGAVLAGPALTARLTTSPAQVWSLAAAADGTLWAGTGGDGRLVRIRPGQPEETVFDAEEHSIFAVAAAGERVYAASSPDGRVYRLDAAGKAQPFFDPSEKYIWALTVDTTGRIWIGAGQPAVIYRVDADGSNPLTYKPPAEHVVSLAIDASGRVLAGTESPGRLYRFDSPDRPYVMFDSDLTELRAITAAADGTVYAAAIARGDASTTESQSTSVSLTVAEPAAPGATPAAPPARRSVLFRIDTTGGWEPLWETPDLIYDLAAQADGSVLAATGPQGRVYRIDQRREVLLYSGVDAKHAVRFAAVSPGAAPAALATANPGRVLTFGTAPQSPATYLSPVRDAKAPASWGQIRWEGAGTIRLFTRAGNTNEPDDSWSAWSPAYTRAAGEAVTSPRARYLQWKAELVSTASAPARLESVTVGYLPRNSRPVVSAVTVHPPGVVFQRPFVSDDGAIAGLDDAVAAARRAPGDTGQPAPAPGRRMLQRALQTFQWKAEDADDDQLTFSVEIRREGAREWQVLRSGLTDPIYVWDTTSSPDGRYELRVVASDAASNTADRVLTGERLGELVQVDNTAPALTLTVARDTAGVRIGVRATDAWSPIQKVEYSINGGTWQVVYPVDGLSDSLDERYEVVAPAGTDPARVVIRAVDTHQNVATRSGGQ